MDFTQIVAFKSDKGAIERALVYPSKVCVLRKKKTGPVTWSCFAGGDAWCARESDQNQYIQVDFERKTCVTGLTTFRRATNKTHLVTKYSLLYSNDFVTWQQHNENGSLKVGALLYVSFHGRVRFYQ